MKRVLSLIMVMAMFMSLMVTGSFAAAKKTPKISDLDGYITLESEYLSSYAKVDSKSKSYIEMHQSSNGNEFSKTQTKWVISSVKSNAKTGKLTFYIKDVEDPENRYFACVLYYNTKGKLELGMTFTGDFDFSSNVYKVTKHKDLKSFTAYAKETIMWKKEEKKRLEKVAYQKKIADALSQPLTAESVISGNYTPINAPEDTENFVIINDLEEGLFRIELGYAKAGSINRVESSYAKKEIIVENGKTYAVFTGEMNISTNETNETQTTTLKFEFDTLGVIKSVTSNNPMLAEDLSKLKMPFGCIYYEGIEQ